MPRCNAKAGTPSDAAKGKGVSWSKPTDLLLLQAPARFDGIEVVGVRREIDHADTASGAKRYDAFVVVGGKVVEDKHVVFLELGEQLLREPIDKALLVGAGEHGGEKDPAGHTFIPLGVLRFLRC
jgi:hypothetical protein